MKKHELLKYAYDNYPKGTRFKSARVEKEFVSKGDFTTYKHRYGMKEHKKSIWHLEHGMASGLVYDSTTNKWAEIITEQSHTLKVSGSEKTPSFEVYETELRLNVNSQKIVFTNDFLEKHLLPAVKAYKKLNKIINHER